MLSRHREIYLMYMKYEFTQVGGENNNLEWIICHQTYFPDYVPHGRSYKRGGPSSVKWAKLIYLPPLSLTVLIPGHLTVWLKIMFRWLRHRAEENGKALREQLSPAVMSSIQAPVLTWARREVKDGEEMTLILL